MTVPRIGPGVGSVADQIEALDRELLEAAGEAGALRRENSRLRDQHDVLRERLVGMAAEVQGLKVALQSKGLIEPPAPVPAASEPGLYLAWSAS